MARKFGRSFEPFDLLPIASLNYRELGKVKIDCQFRQSKSLWGVYGEDEQPAGIIYIDLKFDQPKGCRLSSATVLVTLEGVDYSDVSEDDKTLTKTDAASNLVHMIDRYGPKHLSGEEKLMAIKKTYNGTPNVNVLGNGAGGLGMDIEKTRTYSSRWTFRGVLEPGLSFKDKRRKDARGTVYKSVKWELSENDIETQSVHSNIIHTGFAFQHEGKPCYLRVEIDGKLQRTRDRFKQKLKFPPEHRKSQGSTLTLIDLSQSDDYTKPLDAVADGLDKAMEYENYTEIPSTVPDALPTFFHEEQQEPTTKGQAINSTAGAPANNFLQGAPAFNQTQPQGRIDQAQPQPLLDAFVTASDPLVECLTRALDPIHAPDFQRHGHIHAYAPSNQSVASSDGNQSGTTLVCENPREDPVDISSKEIQKKEVEAAQEAFRRLSQSPALLIFIQFLASFLDFFGRNPGSGKSLERDEETQTDDKIAV
jgi:hypothetical protein